MNKKIAIVSAVLVVAAAIAIAAIAFVTVEKKPEEIKVGAVLPLSGDLSAYGKYVQRGIELAAEEINANGGIGGANITVLYRDNEGKSDKTVSVMNALIAEDKVPVVIGAVVSENTLAVCPIAEKKKVVLISPTSTSPKLSDYKNYVFRTCPSDIYQGKALSDVIFDLKPEGARVAVMFVDNDYGVGLKDAFVKSYQERGEIVAVEAHKEGDTEFTGVLSAIKDKNPDVVVLITYAKEGAAIVKQGREEGLDVAWVGSDGIKSDAFIEQAGKDAEGVKATYPISMVSESVTENFVKLYRAKYGAGSIDTDVAYGYDTMHVVAEAIEKGGYDAEDISDALREIRHHGVCGAKKFDENGDVPPAYDLWKVENAKWVLESKLVI
ncbi:MAG: ABC transporter substrate-binding protein [Methanophagales archaeon]|nr:ABC transporter substrate-binding protein [Methanophagales archaeon]MCW3140509.1 ABC transporter substrate-binding protein [Methanophagales archaeon]